MLSFEPYLVQNARWPGAGRHILAQFDADSIVVYQAFRPMIAEEAVALQRFGPSAYSDVIRSAFRRHSISVPKVSDQDSGAFDQQFRSFDHPFRSFDQGRPSG